MISDIFAWFMTMFVITPVQAELQSHLQQMNASTQTVRQAQQCLATQGPRLIERAGQEPVWAVTTALGVTFGWTTPSSFLDRNDPNCAVLADLLENREPEETGA
ncbi:uncharacterized protein (DUF697 family) [Neorhizobium galegae]|uniref:hypothetical protein n=1 Tax=Neorhizobium galegae TaxID=399 RepID=UPI001AE0EE7A|nr:hypothetical protein [Neorhizobium galegae]MBP2548639.1 uncharacterized protein (DUF697 family) [Neorhizobium galegae]